jgi:hypothetical protein
MPRPVDGDECEQGWCKEGDAIPFLSNNFKMPRLVGGELHSDFSLWLITSHHFIVNPKCGNGCGMQYTVVGPYQVLRIP